MAWRLAYSLETLRSEVNALYPNRNKASDGTIGDPAHASSASDHNPNGSDVVCALDITNDPSSGCNIETLGQTIAAHPQRDCKYVIFNRKIASKSQGWTVRNYTGSDPHTSHIHISVGTGNDGHSVQPYDDRDPWLSAAPGPTPTPPSQEDDLPLHLVIAKGQDEWWLTDWITKRYISTPDQAAQVIFSTRAIGGKIECSATNGPVVYDAATVNAVPRSDA